MRINLTKKDLVNLVYMQLGFSKQISENLIEDFLSTIVTNIKQKKNLNYLNLEHFLLDKKNLVLEEIPKQKKLKYFKQRSCFV